MRYLFTLSVIISSILFVHASGNGGCGTTLPVNYQLRTSAAERSGEVAVAQRSGFRYAGAFYHIVAKTNGSEGISIKKVFETHCELNIGYEQAQIYFYIAGIDTIKDDALWSISNGSGGSNTWLSDAAFSAYNVTNAMNVYIIGEMPGLCGFATYPNGASNGGGVFLNTACCGIGAKTYPHESGHFFNLAHTFDNPVENVTRTASWKNCTSKGDGFCDTPADPSTSRAACPYNGTSTDSHGEVFVPDPSIYMSYFNDNCVNRYTPQEINEINSVLSTDRSYLLNQTMPDITPLDSVAFVQPINGDTTAIGSLVNFKWHSVPRAQYYLFHLQSASSSIIFADTLTLDTTFSYGGLAANKNYKYRVRPISFGNVCETNAPYSYLQTSIIKATINVVSPNCPGETSGTIGVTPSNGVPPYTIVWSNTQTGNTASNLAPGSYTVTITDNNGKVGTAVIVVTDPAPVTVTITKVGNNLNAYGSGGTPPYTYAWSNGPTGQFNNNVPFGNYTVTITDSKSCETNETFVISSTGINLATKVSMKIFPNPASKVAAVNLQIVLNERTEATVSVINVNGEIVQQLKKEFVTGTNNVPLNIEQLSAGIYFVRFCSNQVIQTERISVIK